MIRKQLTALEQEAVAKLRDADSSSLAPGHPRTRHIRVLLALVARLTAPEPPPTYDIGYWLQHMEINVDRAYSTDAQPLEEATWQLAYAIHLRRARDLITELMGHLSDSEERATLHVNSERWRIVAWLREQADAMASMERLGYRHAADALAAQCTAPPTAPARLLAEVKRLRAALIITREAVTGLGYGGITALTDALDSALSPMK